MAVIKKISYTTRDFCNPDLQENLTPAELKIHAEAPKYFLHRAITIQNENRRQGNACSKTRSEVKGGGRKPWKQKGTGRARSGSSTSPLWKGGGVTFGPRTRVYKKKLNAKEKQLALSTALYTLSHRITIVKNFVFESETPNTREFIQSLLKFNSSVADKKALLIVSKTTKNLLLSCRNLSNLSVVSGMTVSLRDILTAELIFISDEALLNFTS
jgi:large subunit ribosomal protein L4